MPKISVIIPVYNTEKYIKKCLKSVVDQTMKDFEVIIVNDGSTDKSEEIIHEFIKNYKFKVEIKYFKKQNGGLSDARNYGVKKANGKYILFVDSDDYIEKDLFEKLDEYINKHIDLIKFKMKTVDESGKTIQKLDGPVFKELSGEEAFKNLCVKDKYLDVACIYLYRRDFFIKNKFKYEKDTYHEDFGLTPFVIAQAKSVVSIDEYGYNYLQRENSITSTKNDKKEIKKAYDVLLHYDNAIEKVEKINLNKETKILIKRYYTNTLLLKANTLKEEERQKFIREIKKRKVYKNVKSKNLKQLIKKIILKIDINLYLKQK